VEETKVAELGNKFLDLTFINKENKGSAFSLRAYAIRHFAEQEDGTAIVADTMGGFVHVTTKYSELADLMAEYDRFIEVRMATLAEGGIVSLEKTQRCTSSRHSMIRSTSGDPIRTARSLPSDRRVSHRPGTRCRRSRRWSQKPGRAAAMPWFRRNWAGDPLVEGAEEILHNQRFIDAASAFFGTTKLHPTFIVVNVNAPMPAGAPHVDIPTQKALLDQLNA
jgi:hypothetical protein